MSCPQCSKRHPFAGLRQTWMPDNAFPTEREHSGLTFFNNFRFQNNSGINLRLKSLSKMKLNNLEAELERLVQAQVNLIFASGTQLDLAAHQVTAETDSPVVFGVLSHPVAALEKTLVKKDR